MPPVGPETQGRVALPGIVAICESGLAIGWEDAVAMMSASRQTYVDRADAGSKLAGWLGPYAGRDDVVVLGLARGGVPVAEQVARVLGVDLDVLVVRKLGVPGNRELAMGAIARGVQVNDESMIARFGVTPAQLAETVRFETAELERRENEYRAGISAPTSTSELTGKIVILVDDGLATGASMTAAAIAVAAHQPRELIVAAPVGSTQAAADLSKYADKVVVPWLPDPFYGVGYWYQDFSPTTDAEVRACLAGNTNDR